MRDFDWTDCPHPRCGRTVPLLGGVLGAHCLPKEQRRWPKMGEECPLSGKPKPLAATMPLLGDI